MGLGILSNIKTPYLGKFLTNRDKDMYENPYMGLGIMSNIRTPYLGRLLTDRNNVWYGK